MVRARWFAAVPSRSGRTAKFRGDLVLTDRRLIFDPLRVTETMSPLVAPYVRDAIKAATRPLSLQEIVDVGGSAPVPVLTIATRRGQLRYRVTPERHSRPWHRDLSARDAAATAISAASARQ